MCRLFSLSAVLSFVGVMLCIALLGSTASAKATSTSAPIVYVTAIQTNFGPISAAVAQIENHESRDDKFTSYVSAVEDAGDDISLPSRSQPELRGVMRLAWEFSSHTPRLTQNSSRLYRPPLV